MNTILLLGGGAIGLFILVRKPEIIAIILFTFILARINFDLPGLPLNLRALMSLSLFVRIMLDNKSLRDYPAFLKVSSVQILIGFLVYCVLVSIAQDLFTFDFLKEAVSGVLATFFVYHFYLKNRNANHLKIALICSGIICFADLAYTYIVFGSFPIHRLYFQFRGVADTLSDEELTLLTNWNFFGQITGMCFVYVLADLVLNRTAKWFTVWLLPVMLLGVLMSTSRSSILALLIITILIIMGGINFAEQRGKILKIGALFFGVGLVLVLLSATLGKYINLDSKFVDEIISRLADEPRAIVNRALGNSYDVNNLGSMDWREESSENAYRVFTNLSLRDQLFGIGVGGFEARELGHGYNAHNALLLLLIENGICGSLIYACLLVSVIIQSWIRRSYSPSLAVVGFILIYGVGQNREWTGLATFLFIFCQVAELQAVGADQPVQSVREKRLQV